MRSSAIRNVDPNSPGSGVAFIGFAQWGWSPSDTNLEAARMALPKRLRDFRPRFELLFAHPTPELAERLRIALDQLERWLLRPDGDHGVPPTIDMATGQVHRAVEVLRSARHLLPTDPVAIRLVVDTNTLVDCPDLTVYAAQLGDDYRVHLLPTVLGEIDDLKRCGRTAELREAAKAASRRIKGLRTGGDVRVGVRVAGDISAVFEHAEPRADGLPDWLDLSVPDDRTVASSLVLQSAHPGSAVYVATNDLNMQTKLAAVGLPHVEPPE